LAVFPDALRSGCASVRTLFVAALPTPKCLGGANIELEWATCMENENGYCSSLELQEIVHARVLRMI
jgi:hypothetical protein